MFDTAKRKSAVELLQESKAFYVKSETVLDRQQQLKHTGHLQVTSSAVDTVFLRGPRPRSDPADHKYIQPHVLVLSPSASPAFAARTAAPVPVVTSIPTPTPSSATTSSTTSPAAIAPPPLPPKSPRLVSAAQRRAGSHHSTGSDQLQIKLRRLLNADSKENLYLGDSWADEDAKTVAGDECPFSRSITCPRSPAGCSIHKSLPDLHAGVTTSPTALTDTSEAHSTNQHGHRSHGSAMSTVSSGGEASKRTAKSLQRTISSRSSPITHCQHVIHATIPSTVSPSKSERGQQSPEKNRASPLRGDMPKSQTSPEKNGTRKHTSRTDDVCDGLTNTGSFSDSGTEDISPQLLRANVIHYGTDRRRPILRSKSDISHRYSRGNFIPSPRPLPPEPQTSEQLERFFEQLGLDAGDYRSVSTPLSGSSSPVFFESVSSVDSAVAWDPESGGTSGNHQRPSEQLSIVERNARIIKWLCNCRKAQLATQSPS